MGKEINPLEKTGRSPEIADVNSGQNILPEPEVALNGVESNPMKVGNEVVKAKKNFLSPKNFFAKVKGMNRNAKLASVLLVILLIAGVFASSLTSSNKQSTSDEQSSIQEIEQEDSVNVKVSLKEGTFEKRDGNEWKNIKTEDLLKQGDVLRTVGATSRSVIAFENGTELRIDANSEVELQTLTPSRIVIKHLSGYTYSRVVPSTNTTYLVNSDDAQYESRGTAFRTATTGDEQSVEVYESSVIETNTNKSAKEGEKLIVKSKVDSSKDGKIEKLNIEQVKNDTFVLWNRELDLKNENFKKSLGFLSDITAPEITINTADGETVLLEPSATEGTIEFSGTTERGAKVTVQSKSQNGSTPFDAIVDSNGGFTTPVISAPVGTATFEFIASDRAGNKTTKSIRVTFQRKSLSVTGSGISLSGQLAGSKVNLNWTTTGSTTTPDGVKVVYSKSENPVYKQSGTSSEYKEDGISTSLNFNKFDNDTTYYFKVCIYDEATDTCGLYSNQLTLQIP